MRSSPATSVNVSESIRRQLNMYALAASAAGVGVLALSQASEARIVYTKTYRVLKVGQYYDIDLNHDGIGDVSVSNSYYPPIFTVAAIARAANVAGNIHDSEYAPAAGVKIGPALLFNHGGWMAVSDPNGVSDWYGYWVNARNRYLGLRLAIKGKTHFGWARLNVKLTPYRGFTAILTGYAYETIPNKPIIAGKTKGPDVTTVRPATLGRLAGGASFIPAWRVKQPSVTTH